MNLWYDPDIVVKGWCVILAVVLLFKLVHII
jgi:hypothetical protein